MGAYRDPRQPVALPGEAVRLEPSNRVFEVVNIEQMARVGPVDFGSPNAGADVSESSSSIIDLNDELDMNDDQLGQFLVNPISLLEIEIRQTGDQDQRFLNKNQVGKITPHDPPQQRLVWVYEDNAPRAIMTNPQTWDMSRALVYFTGYKFDLAQEPMSRDEIKRLAGTPASIPVDSLKKSPQEGLA